MTENKRHIRTLNCSTQIYTTPLYFSHPADDRNKSEIAYGMQWLHCLFRIFRFDSSLSRQVNKLWLTVMNTDFFYLFYFDIIWFECYGWWSDPIMSFTEFFGLCVVVLFCFVLHNFSRSDNFSIVLHFMKSPTPPSFLGRTQFPLYLLLLFLLRWSQDVMISWLQVEVFLFDYWKYVF